MTDPKTETERMLQVWGQYRRHPWHAANLDYAGRTAESRAGEGSGSTRGYEVQFRSGVGRVPWEVEVVESLIKPGGQWQVLYQRYREKGKTDAHFRGHWLKALRCARRTIEDWLRERMPVNEESIT